jgi:hypothetical protein
MNLAHRSSIEDAAAKRQDSRLAADLFDDGLVRESLETVPLCGDSRPRLSVARRATFRC